MAGIIPIPTTRVADMFVQQRLSGNVQQSQLELFRLQYQISTGRRLLLPSDDAPAALRAVNLQRLLDRKGQIRTNIESSNHFLSSADSQLSAAATELIKLRGEVVGVSGNVASDSDRQKVADGINGLLQELVTLGNAKLQERYLFAGARSQSPPFAFTDDQFVEYLGNEGSLRSYVDLERLFETNLAGPDVFGGISAAVEGSVDLNLQLTADTLVSTLNGGSGIGSNPSIAISANDGISTVTNVVDLSTAVTVRDVARLIEDGAPAAANLRVDVTGNGLVLRSDGDTISVAEVAEGRTARMLGILSDPDVPPTATINGLNPNAALLKTSRLSDLLGTKARGVIQSTGLNNDIVLTATSNGVDFNNLTVEFVAGSTAGAEVATYNDSTNTLTVQIEQDVSTANQVIAAITAEGTFTAEADYHDASSATQAGTETVAVASFANVTSGGAGDLLDTASGLILTNGGQSVTLDISAAETVEDLFNLINGAEIGLSAEINAEATGINVRSRWGGADFTIGENGGTTAAQLGIRTYNGETALADFNRGVGVPTTTDLEQLDTAKLDDLRIVARNGVALAVDLTGATSLQDVVDLINGALGNHVVGDPITGTTAVLARLTPNGNGVDLVDSSTTSTGTISGSLLVDVPPGSQAAEYLGFVAPGATQHSSTFVDASGNYVMSGQNVLGHDLVIEASDGTELWIDLAEVATVQDVIDRINNNPANDAVPKKITARLAVTGNGIELVDSSGGAGTLHVRVAEGSSAAQFLGFVADGQTQSDPLAVEIDGSGNQVLTSEDRHTLETDSVFNTLIRLRTALETHNVEEIGRSLERLDADISRLNFARAELGGRLQNLDAIDLRLQDENVQLQAALSQDVDVDLVEAISQLTARQFAYEASLRSAASLMQMSLLNFL